jgi:hypothetical protein
MAKHRSFRLTAAESNDSANEPSRVIARRYLHAITLAVAQQAVVLILAALILDGGHLLRVSVIAAIASWICTALVILRRPKQPTKLDLAIVKYGFWPAILLVLVMEILLRRMVV